MRALRSFKIALALGFVAAPTFAAEYQPFSQPAFDAAERAGRPLLVHAHAGWCPTCRQQQKILKSALAAPAYDRTLVLTIDYDRQKAEQKQFGIRHQATLIAFNHGREQARAVSETDPERLNALIAQAR
jgi:thioredoxin-like negative regulator of GroEL